MQLLKLYHNINNQGHAAIQSNNEQIDQHLIGIKKDHRLGLTILTSLPAHVCRNINICLQEFKKLEPAQYYYPATDMHITIIDIIAANTKFYLSPLEKKKYTEVLSQIISTVGTIHWELKGIIISPNTILVKGYYSDNLIKLRNLIRHELPLKGLMLQERYPTNSGHITIARFTSPLQHPHQILALQEQFEETALGKFRTASLDLVVHDWYNHNSQLISAISIDN